MASRPGGTTAIGALALAALLLVTATACGSSPPPAPSAGAASPTPLGSAAANPSAAVPTATALPTSVATETAPAGSSPAPSAPPAATPAGSGSIEDVLPTPETTDVVLLVGSVDALTPAEQQWLADLHAHLGNVATLAYRDVTLDALRAYFVVFVIAQSADLDVGALAAGYQAGLTIHLIGTAAAYQPLVAAATP